MNNSQKISTYETSLVYVVKHSFRYSVIWVNPTVMCDNALWWNLIFCVINTANYRRLSSFFSFLKDRIRHWDRTRKALFPLKRSWDLLRLKTFNPTRCLNNLFSTKTYHCNDTTSPFSNYFGRQQFAILTSFLRGFLAYFPTLLQRTPRVHLTVLCELPEVIEVIKLLVTNGRIHRRLVKKVLIWLNQF